jgi:hypothetical protein
MAVFTKTKKRLQRPRCEATNAARQRCKLSGREYVDGRWCCVHHVAKLKTRTV